MEPFRRIDAVACPLGLENVDTDQLIPARFMSRPRSESYGGFLLHDLRFDAAGAPKGYILDAPRHAGARALVARRNFGTGSSREAAVYALWDFGIRCVVAPSFGDIFASNAVKNGLLPARVSEPDADAILAALDAMPKPRLTIDLDAMTIRGEAVGWRFEIDAVRRLQLLNGWDDLDITLRYDDDIKRFRQRHRDANPWSRPMVLGPEPSSG